MTIAVTAVTGHLGAEIAKALSGMSTGEPVIGLARTPEKAKGMDIEVRAGDYTDREQLEQSLSGVDTVLLVSGMAAPDDRIEQHRNVISAASAAGVKKIVYTSIQGAEKGTAFSPIVQSNRQTEADIRASGLAWAIGRNGIYIEPDVEYIETYKARGEIANCAGDGKCGYTTRPELAYAYACMLTDPKHDGRTYNLHGELLTQAQLAQYLNRTFGTQLQYRSMSVAEYREERVAELGEFIGTVIAGIYEGIRNGALDRTSDYQAATGRPHQSWDDYFRSLET
ncbi:SDR family oxidoreductase [Parasphingorhabdus sp.]|uniref:SDR family oxidoreductase n=1 Tax=Parasphingorhabdus sp. TaxID=2709688 RepID=UPI003A8F43B2